MKDIIIIKEIEGVKIINTTPHEITFGKEDGTAENVDPCGLLINASSNQIEVAENDSVSFVKNVFLPNTETEKLIEEIEQNYPGAIIVGSIIAAQAYPGKVFGMVPLPGYERVAPAEKRMDPHRFATYADIVIE